MEEREKGLLEINTPFTGMDLRKIVVNGVEVNMEGLTSFVFTVSAGDIVNFDCRYDVKDKKL